MERVVAGPTPALGAWSDGRLLGLAHVNRRPGPDGYRLVTYLTAPEGREPAYAALVPELDRVVAGLGATGQMVSVSAAVGEPVATAGTPSVRRALACHGFDDPVRAQMMFGSTACARPPAPDGVHILRYDPADPVLTGGLMAFLGREAVIRGQLWAPTDATGLRALLANPDSHWLVAVETQGGRVIGAAEAVPAEAWFYFIAVAPSRHRRGLSDCLAAATLSHLKSCGVAEGGTLVLPRNAASRSLLRRFGAEHVADRLLFRRPCPVAGKAA
ncbi:MAG: GNAT family N-acetyltransferase [Sneathiellaceae bacterium]